MMRLIRERLIVADLGEERHRRDRYSIRAQRPEPECRFVIDDFDSRSKLEQWLLNWSPDSAAYSIGRIAVERQATHWLVRFRDAETGKERQVRVPVVGTPPPPGWEKKNV